MNINYSIKKIVRERELQREKSRRIKTFVALFSVLFIGIFIGNFFDGKFEFSFPLTGHVASGALPTVGESGWGTILNNYLSQEHTATGGHGNITSNNWSNVSITESQVSDLHTWNSTNSSYMTFADWNSTNTSYLLNTGDTATGNYTFGSNLFVIDSSSGKVGIGITSPTNKVHINSTDTTTANLRVDALTATGAKGGALVLNTPGGSNHLMFETNGIQKWVQFVDANDDFNIYDTATRFFINRTSSNVGIGTTNPTEVLQVNGAVAATGIQTSNRANSITIDNTGSVSRVHAQGTGTTTRGIIAFRISESDGGNALTPIQINSAGAITLAQLTASSDVQTDASKNLVSISDERLKDIHGNVTYGLDEIMQIQPIFFNYKGDAIFDKDGIMISEKYSKDPIGSQSNIGFSAQNILKVIPEAVNLNDDGYYGLNSKGILATAINSIKELKSENDLMKVSLCNLGEIQWC